MDILNEELHRLRNTILDLEIMLNKEFGNDKSLPQIEWGQTTVVSPVCSRPGVIEHKISWQKWQAQPDQSQYTLVLVLPSKEIPLCNADHVILEFAQFTVKQMIHVLREKFGKELSRVEKIHESYKTLIDSELS